MALAYRQCQGELAVEYQLSEKAPGPLQRVPTGRKIFRAFTASAYKDVTFDFSPPRTLKPKENRKPIRLAPLRFNPFPKPANQPITFDGDKAGKSAAVADVEEVIPGIGALKL